MYNVKPTYGTSLLGLGGVRLLGNMPNVSVYLAVYQRPLQLPDHWTVTRQAPLLPSSGFGHFPNPDSTVCVSGSAGLCNRKGNQEESKSRGRGFRVKGTRVWAGANCTLWGALWNLSGGRPSWRKWLTRGCVLSVRFHPPRHLGSLCRFVGDRWKEQLLPTSVIVDTVPHGQAFSVPKDYSLSCQPK